MKLTRRRKDAQTRANVGVGARRRKSTSASMLHSQEGTLTRVLWSPGILEGGHLKGKSSKSKRNVQVDKTLQRAPSPATRYTWP